MIIKSGDIANMIRKECGIVIGPENDSKTVFAKEELLLVIASITDKRQKANESFIENIVIKTLEAQK
jgi:hypothetical protein